MAYASPNSIKTRPSLLNHSFPKTYELVTTPSVNSMRDQLGIKCLICGMTSYNINDVKNEYCGNCHKFHSLLAIEKSMEESEKRFKKSMRRWDYFNWTMRIFLGTISTAGWLSNIFLGGIIFRSDLTGFPLTARLLISSALGLCYGAAMFDWFIKPWLQYQERKNEEKWKKTISEL